MKKVNITNGEYYNEYFEKHYIEKGIPFNESMMSGNADEDIFSDDFFLKRASELNVTIENYIDKMSKFSNFIKKFNDYQEICLWFGNDTFCQINLLTILAFLEKNSYAGEVYSVIIDDQNHSIVREKKLIPLVDFYDLYNNTLIKKIHFKCNDTIMQKAIDLYFDYLSEDGKLASIIKDNPTVNEYELIKKLLYNSKEYGLSDLQSIDMIKKYRS